MLELLATLYYSPVAKAALAGALEAFLPRVVPLTSRWVSLAGVVAWEGVWGVSALGPMLLTTRRSSVAGKALWEAALEVFERWEVLAIHCFSLVGKAALEGVWEVFEQLGELAIRWSCL